jgi:hypothetical protein
VLRVGAGELRPFLHKVVAGALLLAKADLHVPDRHRPFGRGAAPGSTFKGRHAVNRGNRKTQ